MVVREMTFYCSDYLLNVSRTRYCYSISLTHMGPDVQAIYARNIACGSTSYCYRPGRTYMAGQFFRVYITEFVQGTAIGFTYRAGQLLRLDR